LNAAHPDHVTTHWLELFPQQICCSAKNLPAVLKPPQTSEHFLESLPRPEMPKTVSALRSFADQSGCLDQLRPGNCQRAPQTGHSGVLQNQSVDCFEKSRGVEWERETNL
jgi:hypothetical protein